ncbi:MAG: response regulator, partial [Pyrinomonadaceae bacterium]
MAFLLVVDDDETMRENLCDLFAATHFCQAAATAEQALQWLESDPFDVVLTDIAMPGLSGLELLARVRQRWPETPVIIVSGIRDKEQAKNMITMGAFDYLLKPFRVEEVEASVHAAIEHRRRLRTARLRHTEPGEEDRLRLFVLSLYAENAKWAGPQGRHEPGVVFASSADEAKQKAFDQAHEKWPRAEGWV